MCFKMFVPKDVVLQVLASCCYGIQRMIDIMDASDIILSCEDANAAAESMKLHLKAFVWLALYFHDKRMMLFKLRPKSHYLWHMANDLPTWRLNFAVFHTFSEESFLGKIKAIALKTHGRTMTQRTFQRYLLFMAVFLHQNRN